MAKNTTDKLPRTGYVRLPQILNVIPVSPSTWWKWVGSGKAPKSIKLSPRMTAWKAEEISAFIETLGAANG